MSSELPVFSKEEMAIEEDQGFPKAYAWLCSTSVTNGPLANGTPSFIPRALQSQQSQRVKELNRMFPIIDQEARPTVNLRSYAEFLWEELDHLGNAGFDPALFRVDCFGNVVYRHADSSSPIAWDIDHWFPISRGGKTVPSNLRILQWHVCKNKNNKLDFLIPWRDLQLGISENQFLSIFASRNSDLRSRAFSLFFPDEGEGLECLQNSFLHGFPQKFMDSKKKFGLAPTTIVSSQNNSETMVLKPMDLNRPLRHKPPFSASMESFQKEGDAANIEPQRFQSNISKENNLSALDGEKNSLCNTISCARDTLRKRKEARKQHQEEISRLVEDMNKLMQQNDAERTTILELEEELRAVRKRVEKFRHLSETQAYYRSLLERMIRDAMHQSVVYKKNIAENEAASQALIARLEAQIADRNSFESKLYEIHKEREELEMRALICSEHASKRSEVYDDCSGNSHHLLMKSRVRNPIKKELKEFLKEERLEELKAFEEGISFSFDGKENSKEEIVVTTSVIAEKNDHCQSSKVNKIKDVISQNSELEEFAVSDESYNGANGKKKLFSDQCSSSHYVEKGKGKLLVSNGHDLTFNNKLKEINHSKLNVIMPHVEQKKDGNNQKQVQKSVLDGIKTNKPQRQLNLHPSSHKEPEETKDYRYLVGKENAEKWLQFFMDNAKKGSPYSDLHSTTRNFDEKFNNPNAEIRKNEIELCTTNGVREKNITNIQEKSKVRASGSAWKVSRRGKKRFDVEDKKESKKGLPTCESSSSKGCIPSLPSLSCASMILRLRKSVETKGVISDDKKAHANAVFKKKNMIGNIISRMTKKEVKK